MGLYLVQFGIEQVGSNSQWRIQGDEGMHLPTSIQQFLHVKNTASNQGPDFQKILGKILSFA